MRNRIGFIVLASAIAVVLLPGAMRGVAYDDDALHEITLNPFPPSGDTVFAGGGRGCGPLWFTQNDNPDVVETGSVACSPDEGATTTENAFARCYVVTEDITINCVDFGVEHSSAVQDITITIYEDTDGSCPPDLASAVVLGEVVMEVGEIAQEIVTADFNEIGGVPVTAGTVIIVEVSNPDTSGISAFFIGSNDDGEDYSSYLRSDSCGITDWATFASIGFPDVHIVQKIWYYEGAEPPIGACCHPNGNCIDGTTYFECIDTYDGDWQGMDVECWMIECPQPPNGACCTTAGMCVELPEWQCITPLTWLGAETTCGDDCDGDGTSDVCMLELGLSEDCNGNGIPDECDIADGTSFDINDNGVPDECECPRGNGDFDSDGFVAISDYLAFEACLQGPWIAYEAGCEPADMDGDCAVSLADFAAFQRGWGQVGPDYIVATQLAGNGLSEYPYFEYVMAFNESGSIQIALDPTLYPEITGRLVDVYVVEAKTAGQWLADPTLTDVTAGGAMTETFGGMTIEDNTFTVTGPYELDSAVYQGHTGDNTGLGHGYDMVIDSNRNGVLDNGDYIDGLSAQAGLFVVHDTSQTGPLPVTMIASYNVGEVFGIPAGQTYERCYFPADIQSMDPLPLVVVSHGNGHVYTWYNHIGYHMASYGYIVMAHQNNTVPGIDTCSLTTCGHTDAIIDQQDTIGGGAFDGKLDSSRIIWIGHSRGAEGVAMAYDRIAYSGTYFPTHYSPEDIIFISSMLPTDFYGAGATTGVSNPHEANYHLWTASGDADVSGSPASEVTQTFHLHDRATDYRMSTVIQGTGHAWLHDGGGTSWFTGPCPIGEENTHLIQLGLFLPMIKYYAEGNVPAVDYFWRQYEVFRPPSVPSGGYCPESGGDSVVVNNTYRNGDEDGKFIIDDYQTSSSTAVSSSGGSVLFDVQNLTEGRLDDADSAFTWTSGDPFNGFTYAAPVDQTKGVVFNWNGDDRYMEWEIIGSESDFSDDNYLTFRAGQGTRHPYTIAVLGDLTFTVTLRDGGGTTSSINIGAYGGGVEEPYQRTGAGTGIGWGVEFETIRIRLTDFLHNGSGLDLTDIEAVRFDFGPSWGSNEGRIGVDELALTNDYPPYFVPLTMSMSTAPPEFLPPGVPTDLEVSIYEGNDTLVEGSALLYYRYDGGVWQSVELVQVAGEVYSGTLPAPACGDTPEYYFAAEGAATGMVYLPLAGPAAPFTSFVGTFISIFEDDFNSDLGWTVVSDASLTGGEWERDIPIPCSTYRGDPPEDYDGSGYCLLTENNLSPSTCNTDVDNGPTWVTSPTIDMSGTTNPVLRFAYWWRNDDQDADPFTVEVSNNDGADWVLIDTIINQPEEWLVAEYPLAGFATPTATMKIRFSVSDNPNDSIDEGAVDAVQVFEVECE